MNNTITPQKIKQMVDKIAQEYKPEKIILFGSRAWGNPKKANDVDLFIIKDDKKNPLDRMREVNRIVFERDFAADFLVYTPEQTKKRIDMGDPFVKKILNTGKVMYEKRSNN